MQTGQELGFVYYMTRFEDGWRERDDLPNFNVEEKVKLLSYTRNELLFSTDQRVGFFLPHVNVYGGNQVMFSTGEWDASLFPWSEERPAKRAKASSGSEPDQRTSGPNNKKGQTAAGRATQKRGRISGHSYARSKATTEPGSSEVAYHCCEEWHLARLPPVCAPLYFFARRISHQSKIFVCSAGNLAGFFGYNERSIRRGFSDLTELGFLKIEEQQVFSPTRYRVVTHQEWAEQYPGKCAVKLEYPWAGEGDPLGQRLWVESSCRIKFADFQIRNIRNLDIAETGILQEFQTYMGQEGRFKKPKNVPAGFYLYLKKKKITGYDGQMRPLTVGQNCPSTSGHYRPV
jgi:hypothetical protein